MSKFSKLIIGLLITALFCALAEASVQGLFFLKHGYSFQQSLAYVPDPYLGWRVNPNYLGKNAFEIHNGFRGKAPKKPKPKGTYRIFCLGGSTTFCRRVPASASWPALLESQLNRGENPKRFEVINAGGDGYRIEQCLTWFEREIRSLEPDAIILHVGWNEIGIFGGRAAFFPLNVGNPMHRSERLLGLLVNHSLLACKITGWYRRWNTGPKKDSRWAQQQAILSFEPDFALFENRLRMFVQLCSQEGIDLFLMRYPCLLTKTPTPQERLLVETYLPDLPDKEPLLYGIHQKTLRVLEKVAAEEKVPLLDVAGDFEKIPLRERIKLFSDPIHTTEAGNRRIAESAAEHYWGRPTLK